MKKNEFLIPLLLFTLIGCATIMHGTTQDIGISSNPSSAKVIIDGKDYGKTPLTAKLSRKDNHIIKIKLEGYLPYETTLTRRVSGWVWGNILFGGLIGLAVDAISGGLYKLTPDQIQAELRKSGVGMKLDKDRLYMICTLKPDPTWKKIGQLEKIISSK